MIVERLTWVREAVVEQPGARLKRVVAIGRPLFSFFQIPQASKQRPGPKPRQVNSELAREVHQVALAYPWSDHKRLAVICRRGD